MWAVYNKVNMFHLMAILPPVMLNFFVVFTAAIIA